MSMDWHAYDFTRNHVRLRYWRKGNPNGAPVLLLHGITDSGRMWGRVADGLAEQGFAVIAPDQRGHGESDVPDYGYAYDHYAQDAIALLSYLDKSPAIVMGHSFGGLISMWLGGIIRRACPGWYWSTHRCSISPAAMKNGTTGGKATSNGCAI